MTNAPAAAIATGAFVYSVSRCSGYSTFSATLFACRNNSR